jgi:hypothetical protein
VTQPPPQQNTSVRSIVAGKKLVSSLGELPPCENNGLTGLPGSVFFFPYVRDRYNYDNEKPDKKSRPDSKPTDRPNNYSRTSNLCYKWAQSAEEKHEP